MGRIATRMPIAVNAAAAVLLVWATALASKPPKKIKASANPPEYVAFSKRLDKSEQIQHALNRLTFGPRPDDQDRVRQIGLNKWLDLELHPERVPENALLEQRLLPLASLRMSVAQTYEHYPPAQLARGRNIVASELQESKLLRAVYSNHQLEELLVDFWFNHFNVFENKGADRYMLASYEREAIRPHVFGKFYDLLLATALSPAMLFYLDNWQSSAPTKPGLPAGPGNRRKGRGLNENYGRELLELHTLGVNGGYTQKDVIEVARCFTGWTIASPRKDGTFQYNDRMHDKGQKVVLGHVIAAGGGMDDGLQVLHILAQEPATAQHISVELAQRFVADDPPPSLVHRMAQTFLETDGDLREVTSVMIHSPEFWSRGAYQAKMKSPFEMVVSALRACGAEVTSTAALSAELRKLGEPLYGKIEPTGYSSAKAEWVSSAALLYRMNFAVALAHGSVPGVDVNTSRWGVIAGNDPFALARLLLGEDPSGATRIAIEKTIAPGRETGSQASSEVAGLVLGSPEFQKR